MDTVIYVPHGENVDNFIDFLLHTLEKLHPYGQHVIDIRAAHLTSGWYAATDIETGQRDKRLEAALLHLMQYAALMTRYGLPRMIVQGED